MSPAKYSHRFYYLTFIVMIKTHTRVPMKIVTSNLNSNFLLNADYFPTSHFLVSHTDTSGHWHGAILTYTAGTLVHHLWCMLEGKSLVPRRLLSYRGEHVCKCGKNVTGIYLNDTMVTIWLSRECPFWHLNISTLRVTTDARFPKQNVCSFPWFQNLILSIYLTILTWHLQKWTQLPQPIS